MGTFVPRERERGCYRSKILDVMCAMRRLENVNRCYAEEIEGVGG